MEAKAEGHDPEELIRTTMMVFAALAFLTAATVGVAYLDLPGAAGTIVALVVAATKIVLIAGFFMHLKDEGRLLKYGFAVSLLLVMILIVFVLPDIGIHEMELKQRQSTDAAAVAHFDGVAKAGH